MSRLFALLLLLLTPRLALAAPPAFSVEVTGHGPPLVLIPGLGCDGDVWRATVDRYRDGHQLHVLTLAGFAGQPAIDGPLLPTVRDQLEHYLRERKLHAIIVGHSLGGVLALWLAATAPDVVAGVVVVDAVPFLPALDDAQATAESMKAKAAQLEAFLGAATPQAFAAQNRAALASMITDPAAVARVAERSGRSQPRAVARAFAELMTLDLRGQLAHVRAPSLVLIAGVGNDASTRAAYAAEYAQLPHRRLVVAERARHFIMLDDPSFFFRELDRFLDGKRG